MPVVALLPPENLKVRFFVSEPQFATLKAGDTFVIASPMVKKIDGTASWTFQVAAITPDTSASMLSPQQDGGRLDPLPVACHVVPASVDL